MLDEKIRSLVSTRKNCKTCPLYGKQVVVYDTLYTKGECDALFIGINPGKEEAKQNKPFVGRSGQILRKHIS